MRRTTVACLSVVLGTACVWVMAALPPLAVAQKAEPAPKGKFEFRVIRVGKIFQAIRFDVRTGESWKMSGEEYEKIPETDKAPPGEYDVTLVTDDAEWMAFRIDRVSGATWQMRGNKWIRVKEPKEKDL